MSRLISLLLVAVFAVFGAMAYNFVSGQTAAPEVPKITDLEVGKTYEIYGSRLVNAKRLDGSLVAAREFHFASHFVRSQAVPLVDGRGRKIIRQVDNDPSLPAGYLRLRKVTERDPELEGVTYGDYLWSGIVVEFNLPLRPQKGIPTIPVRG